ncbi:transcriptional repressor [bacterium]|nr:transcriptional repressor [bacterium]
MGTCVKHRLTRQRRIILETLRGVTCHPTADELYNMVREQLPRVSLGTVYRNLELLTSEGEVRTLDSLGSRKRYDGNMHPHYHIKCVECERVGDLAKDVVPMIDMTAVQAGGFKVLNLQLDFSGLCAECQKKRESVTSES